MVYYHIHGAVVVDEMGTKAFSGGRDTRSLNEAVLIADGLKPFCDEVIIGRYDKVKGSKDRFIEQWVWFKFDGKWYHNPKKR